MAYSKNPQLPSVRRQGNDLQSSFRATKEIEQEIQKGNRLASYGVVRASIGLHNTHEDINALVEALKTIQNSGHQLKYRPVPDEEIYLPS